MTCFTNAWPVSRRTVVATIAGVASIGAARLIAAPPELTLDEVVRRNTRARGGAPALDRMHAVAMDIEIVEGDHPVTGRYAANRAGLVRIDIYAGGKNVYAEGVDPQGV